MHTMSIGNSQCLVWFSPLLHMSLLQTQMKKTVLFFPSLHGSQEPSKMFFGKLLQQWTKVIDHYVHSELICFKEFLTRRHMTWRWPQSACPTALSHIENDLRNFFKRLKPETACSFCDFACGAQSLPPLAAVLRDLLLQFRDRCHVLGELVCLGAHWPHRLWFGLASKCGGGRKEDGGEEGGQSQAGQESPHYWVIFAQYKTIFPHLQRWSLSKHVILTPSRWTNEFLFNISS